MPEYPDFFIVGAPKAGTTWLYEQLRATPGVFLPDWKEPHYFSPETARRVGIRRVDGEDKYLDLFRSPGGEIITGEASTAYLRDAQAPRLIREKAPRAKIIISLREPAERAFSHFWMAWRIGNQVESFTDLLAAYRKPGFDNIGFENAVIEAGFYGRQVHRYLDVFGEDRVFITFHDHIRDKPREVIIKLLAFLGVESEPPVNTDKVHNEYYQPRNALALAIIRNRFVRAVGKSFFPAEFTWKFNRHVLGKPAAKPRLCPTDRECLQEIYREDLGVLARLVELPEHWRQLYDF